MSQTKLLTRREAAAFLTDLGYPIATATLAKLHCVGGGPTVVRWGFKPLYRPADLESWATSRSAVHRNTSDPGVPLTESDGDAEPPAAGEATHVER